MSKNNVTKLNPRAKSLVTDTRDHGEDTSRERARKAARLVGYSEDAIARGLHGEASDKALATHYLFNRIRRFGRDRSERFPDLADLGLSSEPTHDISKRSEIELFASALGVDSDPCRALLQSIEHDLSMLWTATHEPTMPMSDETLSNVLHMLQTRVAVAAELHTRMRSVLLDRLAEDEEAE